MPIRPSPRSNSPSLRLVVLLLLLTLGLAVALAYQAQAAARSHRATAEQALRAHAAVAAWDYSLRSKERLFSSSSYAFRALHNVELPRADGSLPPPEVLHAGVGEAAACGSADEDARRPFFRLDLRDGSLVTSGGAMAPAFRSWLGERVAVHARTSYEGDWVFALLHDEVDGRRLTLAYTLVHDARGTPLAAYGFESCLGAGDEGIFPSVMGYQFLPPELTGGLPNDSLFAVTVSDTLGRVLYRSAREYPDDFVASAFLDGPYGGLTTHVRLNPAAADLLVIGGLPRSRLPFLLGLLALTGGLVLVALRLLHRENELGRLRSDFISSVSHELRTPLAQIRMFTETLRLGRVRSAAERRRSLEILDQEARRLTHLVENVLQFSRGERQATKLTLERLDVAHEVGETLELFAPLALARRVELSTRLAAGVAVPADRAALRQMLLNLLDNAVKYGPVGQTVTVSTVLRGDEAHLIVDDEGPGIGPKDRTRIWAPFIRHERDARAVAGSGIGLSVVRELTELHHGRAWVEAAPGGGARFVVALPGARRAEPRSGRSAEDAVHAASVREDGFADEATPTAAPAGGGAPRSRPTSSGS